MMLGILAAIPLAAAPARTVDALLNISTLSDPQICPDGRSFAYVRRAVDGKAWRSKVYVGAVSSGRAQAAGEGSRPRWSPDSTRLAYLHGQVFIGSRAVTHWPFPGRRAAGESRTWRQMRPLCPGAGGR